MLWLPALVNSVNSWPFLPYEIPHVRIYRIFGYFWRCLFARRDLERDSPFSLQMCTGPTCDVISTVGFLWWVLSGHQPKDRGFLHERNEYHSYISYRSLTEGELEKRSCSFILAAWWNHWWPKLFIIFVLSALIWEIPFMPLLNGRLHHRYILSC